RHFGVSGGAGHGAWRRAERYRRGHYRVVRGRGRAAGRWRGEVMSSLRQVTDALCRVRMFAFVLRAFAVAFPHKPPIESAWYLQAMCRWLERAAAGELPRSMISIQPRTLKSFTVAVAWPCWLLGRNPATQ